MTHGDRNKQTSCPFRCGERGGRLDVDQRPRQPQVCRVACNHPPPLTDATLLTENSTETERERERGPSTENSTATLNRRTIHSHDRLDPIFLSLVEGGGGETEVLFSRGHLVYVYIYICIPETFLLSDYILIYITNKYFYLLYDL